MLINICHSPGGRSVNIGKNCAPGLAYCPWTTASAVCKTEGTVLPNTDQPRLMNNIFIFSATPNICKKPDQVWAAIAARK